MSSTHAIARASLVSSFLVSALGIVVIAGWYLHLPVLLQVHPSFAPMQYNTALGFLLSGLAVFCLHFSRPRVAQILAVGVMLIGGLTLWQLLTGMDLHIDQLFMQHYLTVKTATPGRMAPNTALCFLLSGINLWVYATPLSSTIKANVNDILVPVIIALAVIALTGYAVGAESAYGWVNLTRMAVHTAVGFTLLGFTFYGVREAGIQDRSYLPPTAIALSILFMGLWQVSETKEVNANREHIKQRGEQIRLALQLSLDDNMRVMKRMATRWELRGGIPRAEWQKDASNNAKDSNMVFLARYSADTQEVWTAGNTELESSVMAALPPKLCRTPESAPRLLIQDPKLGALLAEVKSLWTPARDDGCFVAVTLLSREIALARTIIGEKRYDMTVLANGGIVYQEVHGPVLWQAETAIQGKGLDLHLKFAATKEQLASGMLPKLVFASGIALTVLLLFALYWLGIARKKEKEARVLQGRVQLELSLRQRVIENSPYGILLTDQEGKIGLVNAALNRLFGYTGEELVGRAMENFVPVDKGLAHDQQGGTHLEYESGQLAANRVVMGRHRDGHLVPIEVNVAPIDGGANAGMVAIVIDVSERIKAQRLIEAQMNELKRINEELHNFTYVASHDLKSPLRGIEQLASWLVEDMGDDLSTDAQNHLRLMRSRIARMEKLLDDLLAYSRAGRSNDEIVAVDTSVLVNEIFELAGTTKPMHLQVAEDLPVLRTRKVPLELVFRNLISNAIKHLDKPEGHITVSARTIADTVEFSVKDNGPGIAPEHQQRVFGMFQTLKPRDEVEGSGIGLALVKKAVESAGGAVRLQSDGRNGCTFFFTWPTTIIKEQLA